MTAFGRKLTLGIYLLLCVAALVFAYLKKDIRDTDLAFLYLMLILTIPSGFALSSLIGGLYYLLYEFASITVPGGFVHNALIWPFFVLVGYLQWFKLVPWAAATARGKKSSNNE